VRRFTAVSSTDTRTVPYSGGYVTSTVSPTVSPTQAPVTAAPIQPTWAPTKGPWEVTGRLDRAVHSFDGPSFLLHAQDLGLTYLVSVSRWPLS
jgi:hypothetical protein